MSKTLTAKDFETNYDGEHTFPFFEDEHGETYTGYGHIDKADFALLVNEYEQLAGLDADPCTPHDVEHGYARVTFNSEPSAAQGFPEWWYTFAEKPTAETIPITWMSR